MLGGAVPEHHDQPLSRSEGVQGPQFLASRVPVLVRAFSLVSPISGPSARLYMYSFQQSYKDKLMAVIAVCLKPPGHGSRLDTLDRLESVRRAIIS